MWRRADTSSAIDLLERASGLLPTADPARLELLCEHGLALRTAGEIDRANRVLEEAAESAAAAGERRIELRARMELANAHLSTHPEGGGDALLRVAEEAIPTFEAFGDDRSLGRAWLLAGYVRGGLHCRNAEWREAAERALDHYRRSGWPPGSCAGEIATSLYYGPTPVAEGIDRCRRLLEESDERTGQAHVLVWLGGLEGFAGRGDVARRLVRRAEAVYDELGHGMPLLCGCYPVLAEIERLGGRLEEAEALLRASCDGLEAMHERACLASRAAELADVMYGRRRYEEAERWFRVAEEHAATDDLAAQLLARAVRGKILARRGSSTAAETCAREAVQIAEQTDALNSRARVLLDLAEIVRLDERPGEARALAARACELLEQKGNVVGAEHARALAADA
jgi:tetratricopeptide (TPR) repeat protein